MGKLIKRDRLELLSANIKKVRIAVIGDLMLDRYVFGKVNRFSPEDPKVKVLDFTTEDNRLGGAANVAHNIKSIGADVLLIGVLGDPSTNNDLFEGKCVAYGLDERALEGLIIEEGRTTTVKTRFISDAHLLRVDYEHKHPISVETESKILSVLQRNIDMNSINGIILEDYNKGVLTESLISKIIDIAKKHSIPIFVDPKLDNFFCYKDVTVFKPNRKEMQDALGYKTIDDEDINKVGFKLLEELGAKNVLLTLSEKGMLLFEQGNPEPFAIPTMARKVADVSGAGDTVIATLAVAYASGATIREATMMANRAAGIVVEDLGIVPIYRDQLFEALAEDIED